jgi:hypothetical protein
MAVPGSGAEDGTGPDRPPGTGGWAAGIRTGLTLAVVFVLGLAIGSVAVGLLNDATPPPSAGTPAGPSDGGLLDGPLPREGTEFRVNAPCLGAVNAALGAYVALEDVGDAATALDAARLDEIVRQLQPAQTQLEADLAACEVTRVDDPAAEGAAPTGTPVPPTTADPSPSLPD